MEITARQWEEFDREGFLFLGRVASEKQLAGMQQRIDYIMLGLAQVNYDQIMMQLDREPGTGRPGPQTKGHKGPTLLYRKIQQLEFDPFFSILHEASNFSGYLSANLRSANTSQLLSSYVHE